MTVAEDSDLVGGSGPGGSRARENLPVIHLAASGAEAIDGGTVQHAPVRATQPACAGA